VTFSEKSGQDYVSSQSAASPLFLLRRSLSAVNLFQ